MKFKKVIIIVISILLAGCASQQSMHKKAVETNTVEKYEEFLQKYPDSEYQSEVKEKIIELEFSNARSKNTISAFETFLEKYPDNKYKSSAFELIDIINFNKTDLENLSELRAYISKAKTDEYKEKAKTVVA